MFLKKHDKLRETNRNKNGFSDRRRFLVLHERVRVLQCPLVPSQLAPSRYVPLHFGPAPHLGSIGPFPEQRKWSSKYLERCRERGQCN